MSIPTSCTIWHIFLVPWCVGLDRFHCILYVIQLSDRIYNEYIMVHSWILIYIPPAVRQGLYISEAGNVIKLLWYFKNSNIFMPFLTLRKVRFRIRCCFCMVKYAKNINFCYWNESFLRKKMFILPTSTRKWLW
jgi:hypothetical protein